MICIQLHLSSVMIYHPLTDDEVDATDGETNLTNDNKTRIIVVIVLVLVIFLLLLT